MSSTPAGGASVSLGYMLEISATIWNSGKCKRSVLYAPLWFYFKYQNCENGDIFWGRGWGFGPSFWVDKSGSEYSQSMVLKLVERSKIKLLHDY